MRALKVYVSSMGYRGLRLLAQTFQLKDPKKSKPNYPPVILNNKFRQTTVVRLLAGIVFLSLIFAVYTNQVSRQDNGVTWVEKNGGFVVYDINLRDRPVDLTSPSRLIPEAIAERLDEDWTGRVIAINLSEVEPIDDLEPIGSLRSTESLYLDGSSIQNYEAIGKLTRLQDLTISATNISDLKFASKLKRLKVLLAYKTEIESITALGEIDGLIEVGLGESKLASLSGIESHQNLESINVSYTQVSDLSPLHELKSLKFVIVIGCKKVSEDELEKARKKLPKCEFVTR